MEEKKQLFRQSSLDRISSPEELNDYVRVANPGVWILLAAIVFFLLGIFIWGIAGELETKIEAVCVNDEGIMELFVSDETAEKIVPGMEAEIDGERCIIIEISEAASPAEQELTEYAMHLAGLKSGEWVRKINVESPAEKADGTYRAEIIIESISPISFILN